MKPKPALNLGALRALYSSRQAKPSDVVAQIYDALSAEPLHPVWISLVPPDLAPQPAVSALSSH